MTVCDVACLVARCTTEMSSGVTTIEYVKRVQTGVYEDAMHTHLSGCGGYGEHPCMGTEQALSVRS